MLLSKQNKTINVNFIRTLIFLALLFYSNNLFCQKYDKPYSLNWITEASISTASLGMFALPYILPDTLLDIPNSPLDISTVNFFDAWAACQYNGTIDTVSDCILALSLLTPGCLLATDIDQYMTIGVMYLETIALTYSAKNLTTAFIKRYRPYTYFENIPQKEIDEKEYCVSFPSRHTALSFSAAAFTTLVFSDYFPESKWKIPVIATSYGICTTIATLRVLSGNHFLSDVLTGAALGTLTGFGVPLLHKISTKISNDLPSDKITNFSINLSPNTLLINFNL